MCDAIGAPELAAHPDYATGALRSLHRDALHADLEARLKTQDSAHWIDVLNKAGVPSGPIYAIDEAFADPQTVALGIVQKVDDVAYLGQPVSLSRTPSQVASHPPALGEHTTEILRDLGCDAAEIAQLAAHGII
jgi:formyl-CoA transferase